MTNSESNKIKCRIIVDAMGGDFAPHNAVVGAIQAFNENKNFELFLVGKEEEIKKVLASENLSFNQENIINAE